LTVSQKRDSTDDFPPLKLPVFNRSWLAGTAGFDRKWRTAREVKAGGPGYMLSVVIGVCL
jgi:hypothetical protein